MTTSGASSDENFIKMTTSPLQWTRIFYWIPFWTWDSHGQETTNSAHSDLWAKNHYGDVIMGTIASQITSVTIVYSIVYSDADQRKHQSSASLVFVRGIHRGPVNSPHKWPATRKLFPFDDVIMHTVDKSCYGPVAGLLLRFNAWCCDKRLIVVYLLIKACVSEFGHTYLLIAS